jgi:integrase
MTAKDFAAASRSQATIRAYRTDWADFTAWCLEQGVDSLPATPATVAAYLADQATANRYKPATLSRRLAAINAAHRLANLDSPTTSEAVRLTLAGIRRTVGVSQRQVKPIMTSDLRKIISALPDDLTGTRDKALLLVGFAGALRRSELAALSVEDIEFTEAGMIVTIRRSKTDQEAQGREIGIPYGSGATCPLTAVQGWLEAAGITSGPIFRRIDRHGHIGPNALQPQAVAHIVKKAVEAVGLDADQFAGHSLRAGLATSAAQNGASEAMIASQTGHKSTAMLRRYIRRGSLFQANAATAAGL